MAGIFYILIGGLGLSMLTSLLEFIYKSKREILKQKVSGGSIYSQGLSTIVEKGLVNIHVASVPDLLLLLLFFDILLLLQILLLFYILLLLQILLLFYIIILIIIIISVIVIKH